MARTGQRLRPGLASLIIALVILLLGGGGGYYGSDSALMRTADTRHIWRGHVDTPLEEVNRNAED